MDLNLSAAQYPLTNASVDEISEKVTLFLTELKTEQKNLLRLRLIIEEVLLDWQEHFSAQAVCHVKTGKRFGQPIIELEVEGERFNPLDKTDEDFGSYRSRLLANMGLAPLYSYERGRNRVVFKLKKQKANPLLGLAWPYSVPRPWALAACGCCPKRCAFPCSAISSPPFTIRFSTSWAASPAPWCSSALHGASTASVTCPPSAVSASG